MDLAKLIGKLTASLSTLRLAIFIIKDADLRYLSYDALGRG